MADRDGPLGPPLVPDIGVLALVPDEWNLVWQPRQQVLFRLSRYFPVVWVDPPRHWRWWARQDTGRIVPGPTPFTDGDSFAIHRSRLPMAYRPRPLARLLMRMQLSRAHRLLARRGCTQTLLYLWRPRFADALELVPFTRSYYHIDDEYSFLDHKTPLSEAERRLIGAVDHVFVASPGLLAEKGGINPNTTFVPNGVDFRAFSAVSPEPADLARIRRPRIGYTGVLKSRLDWPLLDHLATVRPDWSFVFVGPVQRQAATLAAVAELRRLPNVHFLGFKPPQALALYPQHFDVCIMPYRMNHYTDQIYPLKLHEYLASGQPTVGPPIATLAAFEDVVTLVRGWRSWLDAIDRSLDPAATASQKKAIRQTVAQHHDWELIVHTIARTMAARLGPGWQSRLDEAVERQDVLSSALGHHPATAWR